MRRPVHPSRSMSNMTGAATAHRAASKGLSGSHRSKLLAGNVDPESLSRRAFVRHAAAAAALAALPFPLVHAQKGPDEKAEKEIPGKGKAKHLILLSLQGGPSHIDTFDPKTDASVKGKFDAIDTGAGGIKLSANFKGLAGLAGDLCVINSMTSREGNHDRARYLTHTGHIPNPTVKHPSLGSILAKELGSEDFALPHFVAIGASPGDGGYLGPTYGPLIVGDPEKGVQNLTYRAGMSEERMKKRLLLREDIDRDFKKDRNADIPDAQKAMYEKAKRMMDSKDIVAFDLSSEGAKVRDAYGREPFGQGVLMARRLIERGVTAVEVTLNGWDTHVENFPAVERLSKMVDQALSRLMVDLKKAGLFDKTVVACYGEFGRTPRVNPADGRDHYPRVWSALLAGGPFARGRKVGASDDGGSEPVQRPVTIPDFFASFAHAFGFNPLREFEVNERPIWYVDKSGKPVPELFG